MHLALALRELVLMEAPEAEEVLYSVYAEVIVFRFPGRKRGAFCYVAAYSHHVNLGFYYGAEWPGSNGRESVPFSVILRSALRDVAETGLRYAGSPVVIGGPPFSLRSSELGAAAF